MRRRIAIASIISAVLIGFAGVGAVAYADGVVEGDGKIGCTTGGRVIDRRELRYDGKRLGWVYLYWSGRCGTNWVKTVRSRPGKPVYMVAYLSKGAPPTSAQDAGNFTRYARTEPLEARGACLNWGGKIFLEPAPLPIINPDQVGGPGDYADVNDAHCG